MGNLLKRLLVRHRLVLAAGAGLMAGLQFLICAVVSTIDIPGILSGLLKNVPPVMQSLIQQYLGGFSAADLLAFGWNHPIALAVGAAVAIVLAARAVAGEIENGVLELVLSQPISRPRYFAGQALFALAALAALALAGAFGTFLGQRVYALHALTVHTVLLLALNYLLLQFAWYAAALVLSVFGREAGRVAFGGFFLALVSYLVQVIAQLWPRAAFLLPYSLNAYYSPPQILARQALAARSVAMLLAVGAVGIALALWRFLRRDIP